MGQNESDGGFHASETGLECAPRADLPVEQPLIAWEIIRDGADDEPEVWLEGHSRDGERVYCIGRRGALYQAHEVEGEYERTPPVGVPTPSLAAALAQCEAHEWAEANPEALGVVPCSLAQTVSYAALVEATDGGYRAGYHAGYAIGYATRGAEALSEDEAQRREVG